MNVTHSTDRNFQNKKMLEIFLHNFKKFVENFIQKTAKDFVQKYYAENSLK